MAYLRVKFVKVSAPKLPDKYCQHKNQIITLASAYTSSSSKVNLSRLSGFRSTPIFRKLTKLPQMSLFRVLIRVSQRRFIRVKSASDFVEICQGGRLQTQLLLSDTCVEAQK